MILKAYDGGKEYVFVNLFDENYDSVEMKNFVISGSGQYGIVLADSMQEAVSLCSPYFPDEMTLFCNEIKPLKYEAAITFRKTGIDAYTGEAIEAGNGFEVEKHEATLPEILILAQRYGIYGDPSFGSGDFRWLSNDSDQEIDYRSGIHTEFSIHLSNIPENDIILEAQTILQALSVVLLEDDRHSPVKFCQENAPETCPK